MEGNCRIRQAIIRDRQFTGLYLIPASQTRDKSAVKPAQMLKLLQELREDYDYILLDCPAGIEQGFQTAVAGADRALVVTTPEISAIRDADRVIGLLVSAEIPDIIGAVCDDEQVVISTNNGNPLAGTATVAGQAYARICRRLLGEEIMLPRFEHRHRHQRKQRNGWKKKYITG